LEKFSPKTNFKDLKKKSIIFIQFNLKITDFLTKFLLFFFLLH